MGKWNYNCLHNQMKINPQLYKETTFSLAKCPISTTLHSAITKIATEPTLNKPSCPGIERFVCGSDSEVEWEGWESCKCVDLLLWHVREDKVALEWCKQEGVRGIFEEGARDDNWWGRAFLHSKGRAMNAWFEIDFWRIHLTA